MQPISLSWPSAIPGPRKAKSQSWKVDSLGSLKKCSQGHRFENGWDAAPSSLQSIFPQIKRRSIISSPQPLGREDKNDHQFYTTCSLQSLGEQSWERFWELYRILSADGTAGTTWLNELDLLALSMTTPAGKKLGLSHIRYPWTCDAVLSCKSTSILLQLWSHLLQHKPFQIPPRTFFTGGFYPNHNPCPLDYCFLHLSMTFLVIM